MLQHKDWYYDLVTPGYLEAMGMRLVAGRDFTWNASPKTQPVLIINQAAATRVARRRPDRKLAYATGK
jgi:hypothetical protein